MISAEKDLIALASLRVNRVQQRVLHWREKIKEYQVEISNNESRIEHLQSKRDELNMSRDSTSTVKAEWLKNKNLIDDRYFDEIESVKNGMAEIKNELSDAEQRLSDLVNQMNRMEARRSELERVMSIKRNEHAKSIQKRSQVKLDDEYNPGRGGDY